MLFATFSNFSHNLSHFGVQFSKGSNQHVRGLKDTNHNTDTYQYGNARGCNAYINDLLAKRNVDYQALANQTNRGNMGLF